MITRVPVSISMGTRGTRELLMSLLVEALFGFGDERGSGRRSCTQTPINAVFTASEGKRARSRLT